MMSKSLALFALIILGAWQMPAQSQSLDLQERCATDARKTFRQLERENDAKYDAAALIQKAAGDFQSHYNSKINRCLLLINRAAVIPLSANLSNQQRQSFLVDANERRYYASYVETQLASDSKAKVERCELRPTMRYTTACTSRDEYDAFVATYLEQ